MTESPESSPTSAETALANPPKRKPLRKPSKPDAVLAAAVDAARGAVEQIAGDSEVGEHLGVFPEAERLVTHRFAADVPGYVGWQWFATLARVPRGKDVTVCELGLLPSEHSLLAPDWVPWSERVRPEDADQPEDAAATDAAGEETSSVSGQADAPITEPIVPDTVSADTQAAEDDAEPKTPGGEPPVA
ncbi:hypothetical protein GCM10027403_34020 [Arthrobacter tecti]